MSRIHVRVTGLALAAFCALSGRAAAQAGAAAAPSGATPSKGYAEVVAQSAFGNVTSQAYGGEFGYTVFGNLQVYGEAGQIRNVAGTTISNAAQAIAGALSQLVGTAVPYSVKQPVTFFGGGIRYPFPTQSTKVHPYVAGGFGLAKVKNDVTFELPPGRNIADLVTLGDDLTGDQSKPMVTFGAGAVWNAYGQLIVDFQFRYGRIFTDEGINVGRAGIGLGVRF